MNYHDLLWWWRKYFTKTLLTCETRFLVFRKVHLSCCSFSSWVSEGATIVLVVSSVAASKFGPTAPFFRVSKLFSLSLMVFKSLLEWSLSSFITFMAKTEMSKGSLRVLEFCKWKSLKITEFFLMPNWWIMILHTALLANRTICKFRKSYVVRTRIYLHVTCIC